MTFDESDALQVWEANLASKSEATKESYRRYFKRFLERWNITANEFYEEVLEAFKIRYEDPRLYRGVQNRVKTLMTEMHRSGYAKSTCEHVYKAVNSFLEAQGIDEFNLKSKDKPKGESKGQRLVLPEQILEIHDNPGSHFRHRNRALLMFAKDSGLRISDIARLNVGHYVGATTVYNKVGETFKSFAPFETMKTGVIAHIRVGPEAVKAVNDYLDERKNQGKPVSDDSPLFLSRNNERFKRSALSVLFLRLSEKLGKEGQQVSAHSLRKLHTTMLESMMPPAYVAKLQGKKAKGSMGPYEQPEDIPGELINAYMNAYDRIRVFKPSTEDLEARRKLSTQETRISSLEEQLRMQNETVTLLFKWLVEQSPEKAITFDNLEIDDEGRLTPESARLFEEALKNHEKEEADRKRRH